MEISTNKDGEIVVTLVRPRSSCDGKGRYGHEETAVKAADHMAQKTKSEFDVYPCAYCKGFHIGHSTWGGGPELRDNKSWQELSADEKAGAIMMGIILLMLVSISIAGLLRLIFG